MGLMPTFDTSTTVPDGNSPLVSAVVTAIGVARAPVLDGKKPDKDAEKLPVTGSGLLPLTGKDPL
jgi:hypothetical protein